jgi:phospholipase C
MRRPSLVGLEALSLLIAFACLGACRNKPVSPPNPDAGSVTDAGNQVDSGPSDAGSQHDAGEITDAGPVDAGVEDAGPTDAGYVDAGETDAGPVDAGEADAGEVDAGVADAGCVGAGCPATLIEHVVLIVQENHTFDNYFGTYCTAPAYSNPTCNSGPTCCEAAPATDPHGSAPVTLDDTANGSWDPSHGAQCELAEMDDGGLDLYTSGVNGCSSPNNFALVQSGGGPAQYYWQLAQQFAMGDRYFQPVAGASSANDMYFARAQYVFADDAFYPPAVGTGCAGVPSPYIKSFTGSTIADLLLAQGVTFGVYAGGYADQLAAGSSCASIPAACPPNEYGWPCDFDPSDIPFEYYTSLQDNPAYFHDIDQLAQDVAGGTLPAVSYVKPIGYQTEHPGQGLTISAGATELQSLITMVESSAYAQNTLILITYDESGGYFDHVTPPPPSAADGQHYGVRVPLIAVGPFVRTNFVSHVEMEHSSVVRFIEWNWLGQQTGQLSGRDGLVNNIGSLLDPTLTGTAVPEQ